MSYDILANIVDLDKSQKPPIDQSSFFMIIKGHEDLSIQIQTGGLPMPKRASMEYTTLVGTKLGTAGKIQLWQMDMPFSVIEREDITIKDMVSRGLSNEYDDRNELEVEFWAGDARAMPSKKWGTLLYAYMSNEDGGEFDVESENTPLKLSGMSLSGYLKLECTERDPVVFAAAVATLNDLIVHDGLSDC